VLDVAVSQLRVILIALPGLYLLCMYRAALQGIGNGWMPMLSGFLELAMRALAVFLLPPLLGKTGVYVAEIAGWPFAALQVVVAYVVCLRVRERHTFLERTH
jgi:Na+-driven multidrug efflux pump